MTNAQSTATDHATYAEAVAAAIAAGADPGDIQTVTYGISARVVFIVQMVVDGRYVSL